MRIFTARSVFTIIAAAGILLGGHLAHAAGTAPMYPGQVVSGGENTAIIDGEGGGETRT